MRKIIITSLAAAALMGWALPAAAQNLVVNPSFESQIMGDPGLVQNNINGWAGTNDGVSNFGAFHEAAKIAAKDGANVAYINAAAGSPQGLVQSIGAVVVGERYDASAWFGWRNDNPGSNVALELWVGGVISGGNITGGTKVASHAPAMVQGSWVQGLVNYTVPPADAGKVLRVRLATTSLLGAQTNFDHVSVTKTAPTPVPTLTGWALILLCVLFAGVASTLILRPEARRSA